MNAIVIVASALGTNTAPLHLVDSSRRVFCPVVFRPRNGRLQFTQNSDADFSL